MDLLQHDLTHEFPALKDKIHTLKLSNHHFARLYTEYDQINHDVAKFELGAAVLSDAALETLKKQRLHLKDELARMLQA